MEIKIQSDSVDSFRRYREVRGVHRKEGRQVGKIF